MRILLFNLCFLALVFSTKAHTASNNWEKARQLEEIFLFAFQLQAESNSERQGEAAGGETSDQFLIRN